MARPAQAGQSPLAPSLEDWKDCWRGRRGEGAGGSGEMASAPLPASLFPWSRRAAAQPIGSGIWRAAASLWVYAALLPGD